MNVKNKIITATTSFDCITPCKSMSYAWSGPLPAQTKLFHNIDTAHPIKRNEKYATTHSISIFIVCFMIFGFSWILGRVAEWNRGRRHFVTHAIPHCERAAINDFRGFAGPFHARIIPSNCALSRYIISGTTNTQAPLRSARIEIFQDSFLFF